jgi:acetyl-CoA carboxylase biotin carboxylase subunit
MVTGIDLVQAQLRIAAGEPLGFKQQDVQFRGAAIECRITAEDPFQNFAPGVGRIQFVDEPSGPGIRVDSSLFNGLDIPEFYDSMLAKVIAWGADREEALRRMQRALGEYAIAGPKTTIPFHMQLIENAEFRAGRIYTRFLDERFELRPPAHEHADVALIVAAALAHERRKSAVSANGVSVPAGAFASGWKVAGRLSGVAGKGGSGLWRSTT